MKLTHRTERRRPRSREVLGLTLPFDPDQDITAKDRSSIRHYIETAPKFNNTQMVWTFGVLFPDQVDSLADNGRQYASNSSDAENIADELVVLKLLRPSEFKRYDLHKTTFLRDLRTDLDTTLQKYSVNKWGNWASAAIRFKTLFPEDSAPLLSAEQLAKFREELAWDDHSRRKENLWVLANFKLLFPEEFSDIQLDHDDWREVRADLDRIRGKVGTDEDAPYELTFALFSAKILAAEHAEIDRQGHVVIPSPARQLPRSQTLPARNIA